MSETVLVNAASVPAGSSCAVEAFQIPVPPEVDFRIVCDNGFTVRFYAANADFSAIADAAELAGSDDTQAAGTTGLVYRIDAGSYDYVAAVVTNDGVDAATITVAVGYDIVAEAPTALFTVAEARAFNSDRLSDTVKYPSADIIAAEARIRADFARLCKVSFVPTSSTAVLDGVAADTIRLPFHNPLRESPPRYMTVSAAAIDGVALSATELADIVARPNGAVTRKTLGSWSGDSPNIGNVSITATHGYADVPDDIKLAALTVLLAQLKPSEISPSATSYSDGVMTYQIGYAGDWPHPYGLHDVDSRLLRFREERVVIA